MRGVKARGRVVAPLAMRRILVDRARARNAARRGGRKRVELESHHLAVPPPDDSLEVLDEVLSKLAIEHSQVAELVQFRYFGGLTLAQCADALGGLRGHSWHLVGHGRAWLAVRLAEHCRSSGGRTADEDVYAHETRKANRFPGSARDDR